MVEMKTLTIDGTQYEIVDATARSQIKSTTKGYAYTAKSAGSTGYFQVTWENTLPNKPISVYIHTTSISALNGTQFTVVNVTTSGCYVTYHSPKATTSTVTLIIYAFYKE